MSSLSPHRYDLRRGSTRQDEIKLKRLDDLVPQLMDEADLDCWLIISREYADDTIAMSMLPSDWFSSRRRSILVFLRDGASIRRHSVSRYDMGRFFETSWDPEKQTDQWAALGELLTAANPRSIAINTSHDFAHGDGMTAGEHELLKEGLGSLADRIVSSDPLSIHWLETRLPEERTSMEEACSIAHGLLRRALSAEVVTPGLTTTDDVVWWLRAAVQDLGVPSWFQPTVSVQRRGDDSKGSFANDPAAATIRHGDIVHIDFGIVWDGLCTDQQQHAYVLEPGESTVPSWANEGLAMGNHAQDILASQMRTGRTGNEVLAETLALAEVAGLDAVIYTHPLGIHGHGAGPTIGLWDNQISVPGAGDRTLRADTAWSIELMVRTAVAPWAGQTLSIMLEEDAWFDGAKVEFLDGRQTEMWAIG